MLLIQMTIACRGAPALPGKSPRHSVDLTNQILGTRAEGTAGELIAKGRRAVLAQRWQEAADAFEAALAGEPGVQYDPQVFYDLALAYESLGEQEKARRRYQELVRRFPRDVNVRNALVREVALDAHLNDWAALGEVAETILARVDLDPAERMLGLGARGLSKIETGDDVGASRPIQQGLDLLDESRYGASGQLPVAAAMLKYANGELRKLRSEKISLNPPGSDFVEKLERRCMLLLEAQSSYADAIRAVDPQWALRSGYRVGEMYRSLHAELMLIPPTTNARTTSDKQLFYGIMHVRYRVLLEKGVEMMKRVRSVAEKTAGAEAWLTRANALQREMEDAREAERDAIERLPFTEHEVERAIEILKKKDQRRRSP